MNISKINATQNNSPDFKGAFKINKQSKLTGEARHTILGAGCIHLETPIFITCGDAKDEAMKRILKSFGIKFRHKSFNADSYCPGDLKKMFDPKGKKSQTK